MKRTICLLLLVVACKSAKRVPDEGSGSAGTASGSSAAVVAVDAPAVKKDGVDDISDELSNIANRADKIADIKNLDEAKQEVAKLKSEREMLATRLAVLQTRDDLRDDERAVADALAISLGETEKVIAQIEAVIQSANDERARADAKAKLQELKKAQCAANPRAEGCKN